MIRSNDSQDTRVNLSKMTHENVSNKHGETLTNQLPKGDTLSIGDETHKSVGAWQDTDNLVKFGVDMTELSDYLDNIISVVN